MKTAWKDQTYTPMPANALKSEGWTRVAAERVIPDVQTRRPTKTELATEIYQERLRERARRNAG
jgi:hypothetical protein